jgi:hypothetical protein
MQPKDEALHLMALERAHGSATVTR